MSSLIVQIAETDVDFSHSSRSTVWAYIGKKVLSILMPLQYEAPCCLSWSSLAKLSRNSRIVASPTSVFHGILHKLYTASLLAIVQVLFPRRPDVFTPEGKLVDLERSASAFSRYSMRWCTTALSLAGKQVPINELPALDYLTRSKSQPSLLTTSPDTTLWNRILVRRYLGFVKQWSLMFVRAILIFGSPYCVMRLLKSLEDDQGRADDAWIWLIGMGLSSICQTVVSHQLVWIQWSEMGVPLRAQLIMAIFQKAMRRKDSKSQKKSFTSRTTSGKPEAINLIASDTLSLGKFSAVNYIIPSSFVKFFFAVLFLWNLLGWQSTLVGLIVTVLCVPVHTFFIRQQRAAQKSLMEARDKKTKAITEALHALRQIKFSASEVQWEEHIESRREEEMDRLRWAFATNNMKSIFSVTAPFLVAAASICTYAYIQGSLTPSIIFPMIEVLPQLQGTLGFVPVVFLDYFNAKLNASRIDEFLRKPEQQTILRPSPSGRIVFQDASIRWPSDTMDCENCEEKIGSSPHLFSLQGVNLEFPAAELSIISGKTGSGKSLLLAAIIGEIDLLGGSIDAPSMAQGLPTAYVSQTPWLQNATIRDNILFGKPFDKDRYEKVLTVCAFRPDLAALTNGDGTEIGLRGVKLSGGQRARLAFGRALYSNAQLLVLDDIFSALDSQVAKEIFDALTGELGNGRTRILVTHQVSLCLPKTKYIVVVGNSSISYAGTPDLMKEGLEFVETEEAVLEPSPSPLAVQSKPAAADMIPKFKATVKKAKRVNARTSSKVYKKYFASAGGPLFISLYLVGIVMKQLLNALTTWLLGRVKSARPKTLVDQPEKSSSLFQSAENGLQQYLYLYLMSSLMAMGVQALFNRHTFSGSLRASKVLFRDITSRVIRMPLLWVDTTSMGEMLKRFTVDTQMVADQLLIAVSDFAEQFVKVLTVVAVG
jgi:ABC-type multidrug transport system fused ATPase/permease subunit